MSYQCSITIAWDPPEGRADGYRVYYRETDPPGQELQLALSLGQARRFTLDDLDPEKAYEFYVKTVAGGELQVISEPAIEVVFTGVYE